MMIHEKLMTGQFLLDLKNDRAGLLHAAHHHHHHQPHHAAHLSHAVQPPSPPMPTAVKMELYSAYAYQQQLQQHLIGSGNLSPHQSAFSAPAEVLDLSRRCDSVETPRKTPSPYQTNSSFGTGSPAASPTSSQLSQQPQTAPVIPMNLLYSGTAQQPLLPEPQGALPLPPGLASLYPALYYPGSLKQEPSAAATVAPPQTAPATKQHSPLPVVANNNVLHSFSAAAAASASIQLGACEATSSPDACSRTALGNNKKSPTVSAAATTPTSSNNAASLSVIDAKATRPFKAFPRDPLVIAANFAATDVLLDNPRVERYTEYRKRVLEQIRHSNGGARCVTNPKMRRTNSRSGSLNEVGCSSSNNNSETEERNAADESSDCDSNAGNFEKMTSSTTSNGSCASSTTDGLATATINGSAYTSGQMKDAAYYERRRKNNAAAKKSRDRRRIKEDEIAIRAAYLERQNIELLCQIDSLKSQLAAFTSKVRV